MRLSTSRNSAKAHRNRATRLSKLITRFDSRHPSAAPGLLISHKLHFTPLAERLVYLVA
jgi:hypothetical protein